MAKKKILVVEDEAMVAIDIKNTLIGMKYDVPAIVFSGEEALKKVEEIQPDLILMDIVLKGEMDGIEASQQIRERFGIPVVYLTAYADSATLKRAKITEPFGYILKPFEGRELHSTIEMALYKQQSEKALKDSKEFSSSLLNHAPNPIIVINPDTSVRYVNPALEKITGFSSEEIIGRKPPYTWWAKETHKETERYFKKAMKEGAQKLEELFKKKNGEQFWVEITSGPVRSNKAFEYYLENWVDITKRKKAEEELIKSEMKYRELVQNSNSIIIRRDSQGTITFFNEFAQDFFGYTEDEILGKNVIGTIVPDIESTGRNLSVMIQDIGLHPERYSNNENENMRRNGERVWVAWTNKAIYDKDGNIVEILCIGNDITDRKNLQAQLIHTQKMEAIGTLAGGIAHDFNNILSIIIGYTKLAQEEVPEGSQLWEDLREVYQAGNRARDLVKQILTFSFQAEQERTPVKIHRVVTETLKLLRSSFPATIEIRTRLTSTATVLADSTQIEQVIMNLCTNAYHAMRERGGVLEVRLEEVMIEDEAFAHQFDLSLGPYLSLTVLDTGHGMDKSVRERIFEPYFTTKRTGEGTGIGLSVVHGIVKSYGGAITAESEPGRGSIFQVLLPRFKGAVVREEHKEVALPPKGTERILFVDDETALVNIGRRMLGRLGYKVTTRTDSLEALQLFREQPDQFDLVITDMTMPNMTGIRLARELMGICPDIPIILCTGFSELISEERAKEMGIREFVMKPLIMSEMARVVRRAVQNNCSI
jgi:PAS domain S-box-containing protein